MALQHLIALLARRGEAQKGGGRWQNLTIQAKRGAEWSISQGPKAFDSYEMMHP